MANRRNEMILVGFLQAQNCTNYPGSWRHPASASDFLSARYYQRIARALEDAKFHLAFFDDRLAMPDIYNDDAAAAIEAGVRVVKLAPAAVVMAMGLATR
ncbi:MAG: LLM class flavin-dependent oxidoreductase, partial [Pseudomonadota bacterium]